MKVPARSDICVSIRSIVKEGAVPNQTSASFKTMKSALALLKKVKPDRIEWSYTWQDPDVAGKLREHATCFVAAINTINPPGNALDIEGEPCIAPWMKGFGKPDRRLPYMCVNNPDDVQARVDQITQIVVNGFADAIQHDDWMTNAQIMHWKKACFCDYCLERFKVFIGIDLNYKQYLNNKGIYTNEQLFSLAATGYVPLWHDYREFQTHSTRLYLRAIRNAISRISGEDPVFTVNALATPGTLGQTLLRGNVEYLNGETWDFSPKALYQLSLAAKDLGVIQVSSFFPDVPAGKYHSKPFVTRVRRSIAVAYALGVVPLFPYDVYAGNKPRWFGTWQEYGKTYDFVRKHRDWFDKYQLESFKENQRVVEIVTQHIDTPEKRLCHRISANADWDVRRV